MDLIPLNKHKHKHYFTPFWPQHRGLQKHSNKPSPIGVQRYGRVIVKSSLRVISNIVLLIWQRKWKSWILNMQISQKHFHFAISPFLFKIIITLYSKARGHHVRPLVYIEDCCTFSKWLTIKLNIDLICCYVWMYRIRDHILSLVSTNTSTLLALTLHLWYLYVL